MFRIKVNIADTIDAHLNSLLNELVCITLDLARDGKCISLRVGKIK